MVDSVGLSSTFSGFAFDCCSAWRTLPGMDRVFLIGELALALKVDGVGASVFSSSGIPLVKLFFLPLLEPGLPRILPAVVWQAS